LFFYGETEEDDLDDNTSELEEVTFLNFEQTEAMSNVISIQEV